jgi:hypothetical protein
MFAWLRKLVGIGGQPLSMPPASMQVVQLLITATDEIRLESHSGSSRAGGQSGGLGMV